MTGKEGEKEKGGKKRMSVERIYQRKTQLEHILLRPDTYVGSVEESTEPMFVFDAEKAAIVKRNITYVPGLYKIFDEILGGRDLGILVGAVLGILACVFGILVGVFGILVGVFGILVGVFGILVGVFGILVGVWYIIGCVWYISGCVWYISGCLVYYWVGWVY